MRYYIFALIWGAIWASFLQKTTMGRFLALKRTWVTVVIGVGVDLLLVAPLVPRREWLKFVGVIGLSSIAIIFRSLHNELGELMERIHVIKS